MKDGDKFVVTFGTLDGQEGVIIRLARRDRDPLYLVRMNCSLEEQTLLPLSWMKPIETATVVEAPR